MISLFQKSEDTNGQNLYGIYDTMGYKDAHHFYDYLNHQVKICTKNRHEVLSYIKPNVIDKQVDDR